MTWQFTLVAALSVIYVWHVYLYIDPRAALSAVFLVLLALCMESLNALSGPFWIAQDSLYLINVGLPVEKLGLYLVFGTAVCATLGKYKDAGAARIVGPGVAILVTGLVLTMLEWFLDRAGLLRWIRPWTAIAAFIYYSLGAYLLIRFYGASLKAKLTTYGILTVVALGLATLQFHYGKQAFPLVRELISP
jgi:hypothetical protein